VEDTECQEGESQKLASLVTGGKIFPLFTAVHLQSRFNALIKGEEEQLLSPKLLYDSIQHFYDINILDISELWSQIDTQDHLQEGSCIL